MFRRLLPGLVAVLALLIAGTAALSAQNNQTRTYARVAIAHLAPFAPQDTAITPALDGDPLPGGPISFGQTLSYHPVDPGTYTLQFFAGSNLGGTPVLTRSVTLEAGKDYTATALGGTNGFPARIELLTDDNTPPGSTDFRVRLVHAAAFAAGLQNTAVDIVQQNGTPIPGLQNITFGAVSPYLSLPALAPLDVKIVRTGTQTLVIDPPALQPSAGDILTIFAVSGVNGANPSVVLLEGDVAVERQLFLPSIFNGAAQ